MSGRFFTKHFKQDKLNVADSLVAMNDEYWLKRTMLLGMFPKEYPPAMTAIMEKIRRELESVRVSRVDTAPTFRQQLDSVDTPDDLREFVVMAATLLDSRPVFTPPERFRERLTSQ